jgi:acyl-coenzyme A thioesterase PaaI-like protein
LEVVGMNEIWTFGVDPLPQTRELAPLLRRVAGLALALDAPHPAVDQLMLHLRAAEREISQQVSADLGPRLGPGTGERVYVDHSRDIGAYNPAFPEYDIEVSGDHAAGTVTFPLAFEGPPGVVHGGVLATFFDCVIQHHNCDVGVAGKTSSLHIAYRRPTPLLTTLDFHVERAVNERRITSQARLTQGETLLCSATMEAVAGQRENLPVVSPRRLPA